MYIVSARVASKRRSNAPSGPLTTATIVHDGSRGLFKIHWHQLTSGFQDSRLKSTVALSASQGPGTVVTVRDGWRSVGLRKSYLSYAQRSLANVDAPGVGSPPGALCAGT
ncbi:hypothetical protein C8Q80DRAFT_591439 [Daedaleopsis nitida]|nr:hypothetical protein C8Q80DRAFT_591439 [Daedaleopsis nitida]